MFRQLSDGKSQRRSRRVGVELLEGRTLLASPADLLITLETGRVMALVPDGSFQDTAIHSGDWASPATWQSGSLPRDMDNVLIAPNVTVTISSDLSHDTSGHRVAIHALRVDGTLTFDIFNSSKLLVDTIIVSASGTFQMGTASAPIPAGVQAQVVFADNGPVNAPSNTDTALSRLWPAGDPFEFSRGLIVMGAATINGAEVTSFEPVRSSLSGETSLTPGSTTFSLASVPAGWHVGDQLIITGNTPATSSGDNQDEQVQIKAISGTQITISVPLQYLHYAPAGFSIYVADVTRNVVFQSENTAIASRGHVMFMHTMDIQISSAGFYGLGRTDKGTPINDPAPIIDPSNPGTPTHPNLIENGTGTNPRGRYSIHFHHDLSATINDSAVVDSPGWGITNHSSDVNVTNNVVFNAAGAAYATEAGDETGVLDHNIAIHSKGASDTSGGSASPFARQDVQDFGFQGIGYWFQGNNLIVTNNVSTGSQQSGFFFISVGLTQKLPVSVDASRNYVFQQVLTYIPASALSWTPTGSATMVTLRDVPIRQFSNNVALANGDGMEIWGSLTLVANPNIRTNIDGFKVYGSPVQGVVTGYSKNISFHNVTLLGDLNSPPDINSFGIDGVNQDTFVYDHVDVRGYGIGIRGPYIGTSSITDCTFQDIRAIYITPDNDDNHRVINITGCTFLALPPRILGARTQYDIDLEPIVSFTSLNISPVFNQVKFLSTLGTITFNGQQLYYDEQAANFIPFPSATASSGVPSVLKDKTNAALFRTYGLAVGGIVAPGDAVTNPPRIHGVLGKSSSFQTALNLVSPTNVKLDPTQLASYLLSYRYVDPATAQTVTVTETTPTPMIGGWNLLTRSVAASTRTFLVYNDFVSLRLDPIADQSIHVNGSLSIPLGGHDIPGSTLTYSARATITSTTSTPTNANPLYRLKTSLGLYFAGTDYFNWGGKNEKWLHGSGSDWYFILPDGSLVKWDGGGATGTLITNVGTNVYADPSLLYNAQGFAIALSVSGSTLTITPDQGFTGTFVVDVTVSNGSTTITRSFLVKVDP